MKRLSDKYKLRHTKKKKGNKRQKRQEVVYTYLTRGCIAFSSLGTVHIPQVQVELQSRGIVYDSSDGITKLVQQLKAAVLEQDGADKNGELYKKAFHPKSDTLMNTFPGTKKAGEI
jgi:hypothetical protein